MHRLLFALTLIAMFAPGRLLPADDDKRTQYPEWMQDSFYEFSVGVIDYPFTTGHLEPGHGAGSVRTPHLAARATLLGHRFNRYLSARLSVMRPVWWVTYEHIDGTERSRTAWPSIGGITARASWPVSERLSLFGESGLAIVSRHGIEEDGDVIMRDANYVTYLLGGGLTYRMNRTWDLQAGGVYVPGNEAERHPYTVLFTSGVAVNLRAHTEEEVVQRAESSAVFPLNTLQLGWTTNALGIGFNDFVSDTVPIFWGGDVKVQNGLSVHYIRNLYHTKSLFSLDLGITAGYWQGTGNDRFWNASLYKQFKLTPIRTKKFDVYVYYAIGGPTFISKTVIDGIDTGRHFTFVDWMGCGLYLTENRDVNIDFGIGHFSNGNLFSQNAGVMLPFTIRMGFTF